MAQEEYGTTCAGMQSVHASLPLDEEGLKSDTVGNIASELLSDDRATETNSTELAVTAVSGSDAIPIHRPERRSSVSSCIRDQSSLATAQVSMPLSWPLAANQSLPGFEALAQIQPMELPLQLDPPSSLYFSWPPGNAVNSTLLQSMSSWGQDQLPTSYRQYRRPRTVSVSSMTSEMLYNNVDEERSSMDMVVNEVMDGTYSTVEHVYEETNSETLPSSIAPFIVVPDVTDPLSEEIGDTSFHANIQTSDMYNFVQSKADQTEPLQRTLEGQAFSGENFHVDQSVQLQEPSISVKRQPPHQYRVRYVKETSLTPKGLLKGQDKEPTTIQLENVPPQTGDIPIEISVRTTSDKLHPTIYATCFGKSMPSDWRHNTETGIVHTIVKEADSYRKQLHYLAVRRRKKDSVDVTSATQQELKSFRVKIQALIPSAQGRKLSVSATTRLVQAVCPNKMTKLRMHQKHGDDLTVSPAKKTKA